MAGNSKYSHAPEDALNANTQLPNASEEPVPPAVEPIPADRPIRMYIPRFLLNEICEFLVQLGYEVTIHRRVNPEDVEELAQLFGEP